MESEIVNITKIKDGYFLGDEATAANLDVIFQFKITHMINAAGPQILNAWENIGTKYLTLNWNESPNQNLFDPKDEIANRIVGFIDDSFKSGEGFLVHSVRGQNRACLVVLIYFIRKYRWTLKKSMEFLSSKKNDIDIPSYFINQITNFETRLTKYGYGPKSANWNDVGTGLLNDIDNEEVLIRNTYLNGIVTPSIDDLLIFKNGQMKKFTGRRIIWSDQTEKRSLIAISNKKDLLLQNPKDMKPILNHKKMKPVKSSLKSNNQEVSQQNSINTSNSYITPSFIRPSTATSVSNQKSEDKALDSSPIIAQRVNKFGLNSNNNDTIITNNYLMNQTQQFPPGNNKFDQGIKIVDNKQNQVEQLPVSGIKVPNHSFLRDSSIKRDKYSSLSHTSKQQPPTTTTNYYDYYTNNMKPLTKNESSNKVDSSSKQLIEKNNSSNIQQRPSTADNSRTSNQMIGANYGLDFKDSNNSGKIIISPQVQNIVNTNIYIQQDDVRKIMGSFGLNQQNQNFTGGQSQQNQPLASKLNKNPENQRVLNNDYFNSSSNSNPHSFLSNTKGKQEYEGKGDSTISNNIFRVDQNNVMFNNKPGTAGESLKKTTNSKSTGKVFLSGQNAGSNAILDSSLKKNFVGIRPQVSTGPVKLQTNDYFKKPMTPDTSNIGQPSK